MTTENISVAWVEAAKEVTIKVLDAISPSDVSQTLDFTLVEHRLNTSVLRSLFSKFKLLSVLTFAIP